MSASDDLSAIVIKPRPPWWRRWLKRLGKGLLVAALLIACRMASRHYQVTKKLSESMAELDRAEPGWRLQDLEAAREPIPEEENSARVIVAAARLLPKDWPPKELDELFSLLTPEEQLAAEDFARLKQELDNVRPALEEARKLAIMRRGRYPIKYQRNVLATLLPGQSEVRRIARLLVYDAMRRDQEGEPVEAMIDCLAAFNAGRSLGDEPFAVSQMIRISGTALACRGVERALAQGQPPPEEMVALQRLLADEDAFPDLLVSARGERAGDHATMEALECGDISSPFSTMSDSRKDWNERLFGFLYRDNLRDEHPTMLALMSRWVALAQLPSPEQSAAEQLLDEEGRNLPKNAIMTRLLFPAIVKMGTVSRRNHGYLRCLNAALAAERYRRANKSWPESLEKLCPNYLAAVPLDPFDNQPLRYRQLEDGVIIYAIGQDEVDDGGILDHDRADQPGVDIGYRLWDVAKRRQPPRPKPPKQPAPPQIPPPALNPE